LGCCCAWLLYGPQIWHADPQGGTDPANANSVGKPRGQGLSLGDLL
jgi:hypothetical protein